MRTLIAFAVAAALAGAASSSRQSLRDVAAAGALAGSR